MKPSTVVEVEIGTYIRFQLPHGLVEFQVDVLVLETPPQTLHPDVVQCPTLSIHAHLNVMVSKHILEHFRGELAPLIRVEYGRTAVLIDCLLQEVGTLQCVHGVEHSPAECLP